MLFLYFQTIPAQRPSAVKILEAYTTRRGTASARVVGRGRYRTYGLSERYTHNSADGHGDMYESLIE
jgi:hypothetical protein